MDERVIIQQKPPKSPAAAAILSVIMPGLGNLYNGLVNRWLVELVAFAGLIVALIKVADADNVLAIVFTAVLLAGFWFFQIFDAANCARAVNQAAAGQKPEGLSQPFLPQGDASSSIFWGAVLIILGLLVILMNFGLIGPATFFTVLVPAAVIVIGLRLVVVSVAKAKGDK